MGFLFFIECIIVIALLLLLLGVMYFAFCVVGASVLGFIYGFCKEMGQYIHKKIEKLKMF